MNNTLPSVNELDFKQTHATNEFPVSPRKDMRVDTVPEEESVAPTEDPVPVIVNPAPLPVRTRLAPTPLPPF